MRATASSPCASFVAGSANFAFSQIQREASAFPVPAHFWWCPGHGGIKGNELADAIASTAAAEPNGNSQILTTLAAAKRLARESLWEKAQISCAKWKRESSRTYSIFFLFVHRLPKGYLLHVSFWLLGLAMETLFLTTAPSTTRMFCSPAPAVRRRSRPISSIVPTSPLLFCLVSPLTKLLPIFGITKKGAIFFS